MAHGCKANRTEIKGVAVLEELLVDSNVIEPSFRKREKEPVYDGYFDLLDGTKDENIIRRFTVQIKSESEPYISKKNDFCLSHQMDCDFLRSVKNKVDSNPSFYFVISTVDRRIFYKFVDDEFLSTISDNDLSKEKITYHFKAEDELTNANINCFLKKLYSIHDSLLDIPANEKKIIKNALSIFNKKINRISFVKDSIFPNLYSFGIATDSHEIIMKDKENNVVAKGKGKVYSIYPRFLSSNDKEYRIYNENDESFYTHLDLTGENNPINSVNGFLKSLVERYFYIHCGLLELCSDYVLNEVAFWILDQFSKVNSKYALSSGNYTFFKNNISFDELYELSPQIFEIFKPNFIEKNNISFLLTRLLIESRKRKIKSFTRIHFFNTYTGEKCGHYIVNTCDEESYLNVAQNIFSKIPNELNFALKKVGIIFSHKIAGNYYYNIEKRFNIVDYHLLTIKHNMLDKSDFKIEYVEDIGALSFPASEYCCDFDFSISQMPIYNSLINILCKLISREIDIEQIDKAPQTLDCFSINKE